MSEKNKKQVKSEEESCSCKQTEDLLIKENESLKLELEEQTKQAEDYKDKWLRNVAEFDNYKKRNAKLWSEAHFEGVAETVYKILPIGDNLDRALSMDLEKNTLEGIKNLKRQFDQTLQSLGVEEINPVNEVFDPNIAEAVMQVAKLDGEVEDTVKQVFEKGYKIKDKIIRYAKVSVIK